MSEKLLTVEQVAGLLNITPQGVYGFIRKKKIPAIKISRRCVRFRFGDIEAWLKSKSQAEEQSVYEPYRGRARGRPRKGGVVKNDSIDRIVNTARKEVLQ